MEASQHPDKMVIECLYGILAIFCRCSPDGTNLWVDPFSLIAALYYFDISLSSTFFLVPNPAVFIRIIIFSYVFKIWYSVILRIGSDKI